MALNDIAQLLLASKPLVAQQQDIAPAAMMPAQAFTWGAGGARLTPEDLTRQRAIADQQVQGDYSPVQSWSQGLGRVLDGLTGGIAERKLDKKSAEMQAADAAMYAQALGPDADLAPLLDTKAGTSIVDNLLAERHPKAPTPTEFERMGALGGLSPDQIKSGAAQRFDNMQNPIISGTIGGNSYMGPQDWVMSQFAGGGGQTSGAPGVQSPAASVPMGSPLAPGAGQPPPAAIQLLQQNPSLAGAFDEKYGVGLASRILGR